MVKTVSHAGLVSFVKKSREVSRGATVKLLRQFWNTYRPFLHWRRGFKSDDVKELPILGRERLRVRDQFSQGWFSLATESESESESES